MKAIPKAGPAKGARVNAASAVPRVPVSHISEIKAPEFVSGDAANTPARNRNTSICAVFCATAQAIWNIYR